MTGTATYFFMSTGGVGMTPDGTIPAGAVICTEAQYENPQQYYIDSSTEPPTIQPIAAASALQLAQAAQIMKISQACQGAIYSGYLSNALGSEYLYPSKATDQVNMLSSLVSAMGFVLFNSEDWKPNTQLVEGECTWLNRQLYIVVQGGTTSSEPPNWPSTPGATVVDGSVIWDMWTTPFWCADMSQDPPDWEFRNHTLRQIWQVGSDAKTAVLQEMAENTILGYQVYAATTIQQVEAIQWP
jgi:hypothetical protein